jgi:heme-degrading monooxygenase HmoA
VHLVDAAEGFVDLQIWRSDRDCEEVWMVSRWRERHCFSAYMRSDEHARSHARIGQGLNDAIAQERLEHLHSFDVVAE